MSDDKGTKEPKVLATPIAGIRDARPRFKPVTVLEFGGQLRIRRMEPEQVVTVKARMQAKGIKDATVNDDTRFVLQKMLHCSLVSVDSNRLLLGGDEGFRRIAALSDARLQDVAQQIIDFNELV